MKWLGVVASVVASAWRLCFVVGNWGRSVAPGNIDFHPPLLRLCSASVVLSDAKLTAFVVGSSEYQWC